MPVIKVVDVVNKFWSGERDRNKEDKMIRECDVRSKGGRRSWYFRKTGELQVIQEGKNGVQRGNGKHTRREEQEEIVLFPEHKDFQASS